MDEVVEADVLMDYVTIQIYPAQNRYEAFAHSNKRKEKVATGNLGNLLLHLPQVKNLYDKGSDASLDLYLPEKLHGAEWFVRSSFQRFMHIVDSPDLVKSTSGIMEEMLLLDESKKFHLSLYVQHEAKIASSDVSKNELLQAMDLRLTTLTNDLLKTFNRSVGALHSYKDISYSVEFARQFGTADLEQYLQRFLELIQMSQADFFGVETYSQKCDSKNDDVDKLTKNVQISKAVRPVKYDSSPAKIAEIERQSSTESEESSYSNDEGRASTETSRTLIRSATPRRSASPMRRVQIGRTGPRRAAAITIKSLNYLPSKERPLLHRDIAGNGSEGVLSEQHKKSEIDVRRITVQDAINLFESKQRDQTADIETRRSLKEAPLNPTKSVLRRWSAGMNESPAGGQLENISDDSNLLTSSDVAISEVSRNSEAKPAPDQEPESPNDSNINGSLVEPQKQESDGSSGESPLERNLTQENEIGQKMTSLTEWNQQKELELNQMLMKMMESKHVTKSSKPQPRKTQNLPPEQSGGSYDSYKEKRDAKLRGENTGKGEEKEVRFQGMQKILDKRKAETATKYSTSGKTSAATRPQKSQRDLNQHVDSPKEVSKSSATRKVPYKPSTVPSVRKSWSATPSLRETGISPAKVHGGISSAGSTPMRQKPQPKTTVAQTNLKNENPQLQHNNTKETQTNRVRSSKSMNEKQKPSAMSKSGIRKETVATPEGERSIPSKLNLRNKVTKKSSVVPLESKPSVRRVSGVRKVSGVSNDTRPVNKIKDSPKLDKSLSPINKMKDSPKLDISSPVDKIKDSLKLDKSLNNFKGQNRHKELDIDASDEISRHLVVDNVTLDHCNTALEAESGANSNKDCNELENLENVYSEDGNVVKNTEGSSSEIKVEESAIASSSAWVEVEEQLEIRSPCRGGASQPLSPAHIALAGVSSPRVRHSLSQMLQEEISEPDSCEWGTAENPPAIICQKDAPKGFKRLLKFARKSKGDANSSGRSSPTIFSEGEDDTEESKVSNKRNAAFHTKNYGQHKSSLHEGYGQHIAQSNLSKFEGQNFHKMQDTYDGFAGSTSKATRFFSLSAFRGNKPSERRLR